MSPPALISSLRTFANAARPTRAMFSSHAAPFSSQSASPVRLVLFDVFDTLCTPRHPIHEQYYEEAIRAGISSNDITPESVRAGFKPAFKDLSKRFPLYGKHASPPIDPEEWWTRLIRSCMSHAGVKEADLDAAMPTLGPSLLHRFESDVGYRNFPETIEALTSLRKLGIKTSIVSNADPRILSTLSSLRILPLLTSPPTLSWDLSTSKPSPEIFQAACKAASEEPGQGVIMVGDELEADYNGALSASLEPRLIRRIGDWSDGAVRTSNEALEGVSRIESLMDVVEEVKRRNGYGA